MSSQTITDKFCNKIETISYGTHKKILIDNIDFISMYDELLYDEVQNIYVYDDVSSIKYNFTDIIVISFSLKFKDKIISICNRIHYHTSDLKYFEYEILYFVADIIQSDMPSLCNEINMSYDEISIKNCIKVYVDEINLKYSKDKLRIAKLNSFLTKN